jgi:hypothetical protein
MKSLLLVAALAGLLSGCVVAPPAQAQAVASQDFPTLVSSDLDAAITIAKANNDQAAVNCYSALKADLATVLPAGDVPAAGAISAFEKARVLRRRVQVGVSEAVHIACSPLLVDAARVASGLALLFK